MTENSITFEVVLKPSPELVALLKQLGGASPERAEQPAIAAPATPPQMSVGRMPKQPELARVIRDSRKAKGYSQADLAKLIGMTGCAVSGWETGKVSPTKGAWKRLCCVLWPGRQ